MKLALVGRDGVINARHERGVHHRTQLTFIDGSITALAKLSKAGYTVIVVTHQPGISRGLFDLDELEAIHSELISHVENEGGEIAAVFYCPHDQQDRCHCAPPETGLLDVIELEFDCDTAEAYYFYHTQAEQEMMASKCCKGIFCDEDDKRLIHMINGVV